MRIRSAKSSAAQGNSRIFPVPARTRAGAGRRRTGGARGFLAAVVTALMIAVGSAAPTGGAPAAAEPGTGTASTPTIRESALRLPVGPEPDGPVTLDVSVFVAAGDGRRPAILLAHGFGGSKADLAQRAQELAQRGYVVATYTARGFGVSGGRIHLNDPRYEIADASALVSHLATHPQVHLDAAGDPRVGVAGASYGGALALMTAALDPRVDAVVPAITWNDLSASLAPSGVLKRQWTSVFFSGALAGGAGPIPTAPAAPAAPVAATTSRLTPPTCGRFAPEICALFLRASAEPSRANLNALAAALRGHSPAAVLPKSTASAATPSRMPPTLLIQGMADSLFGIEQAQSNAADLLAAGATVAMRWFDGGHDGGSIPSDEDMWTWFDRYLTDAGRGRTGMPIAAFSAPVPSLRRGAPPRTLSHDSPPRGIGKIDAATGPDQSTAPLAPTPGAPPAQRLISPPGGAPAAMVTLPGLPGGPDTAALSSTAGIAYRLATLPGQAATFDTTPIQQTVTVVGAPKLRLSVMSTASDATLFLSWWRVTPTGNTLPRRLVTAVKVATTPGRSRTVEVALPAATYVLEQGSTWRVVVSATETGYAVPTDARLYTVSLARATLALPTPAWAQAGAVAADEPDSEVRGVGLALALALAVALAGSLAIRWRSRRVDRHDAREDLADIPLVVDGLVKTYRDGHRAVDDVSWRAERGQIVGLLGPNGAGKTTTMRMIVGLIRPAAGRVYVHGVPVHAGSPVLARVGTLIEGPGFLPHLTGRANLAAYWQLTGRPQDEARLEEALDVAALGDAIDRPVRSYSHGMKQRLGIAQAMLGMPEVLLLDEPTNGLDPPQIAAMRPILRRYADSGRTVVISSHLLAEVEATCTHVVVMARGKVVLEGAVETLTDSAATTIIDLAAGSSPRRAARIAMALRTMPDTRVEVDGVKLAVHSQASRADVVAAVVSAGGAVVGVAGHRKLEEVFLGVIAQGDAAPGGTEPGPEQPDDPGHPPRADGDPDGDPDGGPDDGPMPPGGRAGASAATRLDALRQVRAR